MAAPRLTKDVLDGLGVVLAHARAGGPDDLGIDWHPHREENDGFGSPEDERKWEQVQAADAWLDQMLAHRQGEKIEDPPLRLPAAVLRGLGIAFALANGDMEADETADEPQFNAKRRRDFREAQAWADRLIYRKKQ